jgi:hypothetical protein
MNFKLFFENSSNNIYYHGSDNVFDRFSSKIMRRTDNGYYGYGFYFSPNIQTARNYGPNIYKCELNFKNPLVWKDSVDSLWEKYECIDRDKNPSNSSDMAKKLTSSILSEGYDSVIVNNYQGSNVLEVCVFDSSIIKIISKQIVSNHINSDEYL